MDVELLPLGTNDIEWCSKTTIDHINVEPISSLPSAAISEMISNHDNLNDLKRSVAKLHRPIKDETPFHAEELEHALILCLSAAGHESYPQEYAALSAGKYVKGTSCLRKLNPFIDENGLLRAEGRLKHADISLEARNPVILGLNHHLTDLIIRDAHQKVHHSGVEWTLSELRWKYWVPRGRRQIRKILSKCRECRLSRSRPRPPLMASLPKERLQPFLPAFTNVGLDFFGPLYVVIGRKSDKRYGLLITCLATRAVHLEVVWSLTSDAFINALRRFISVRGKPAAIFSDNGTNLVAGETELSDGINKLNSERVTTHAAEHNIKWHFSPPSGPHFGGIWERMVQSSKRALRAVLQNQSVTDEVLQTVFSEVMSLLNGRPLTNVHMDPSEPEALTPNHFILGRHEPHIPPTVTDDSHKLTRRRWMQTQFIIDQYWARWMREYIPNLIERQKWFRQTQRLEVGDEVIIIDENHRRGEWPVGIVIETFPDKEGVVRKAVVKTKTGEYLRPVIKLCVISENNLQPE
ncbi:uncharacterized protein LOC123467493 [Daphnia magna]|uniref:uncharacterized protein LOC123467493 n=1 Tax=Daphnia magna TaxID=35525 RepID=UPI001E1BD826|nr:uncharacterized protein LOC123467493 [Daphnia magna]